MQVNSISDFMSLDMNIFQKIDWQYVIQPILPYLIVIAVALVMRFIAGLFFTKLICRLAFIIVIVINIFTMLDHNALSITKKRLLTAATEIVNTTAQYIEENAKGLE